MRAYKILVDRMPAGEIRSKETKNFSIPSGDHTIQLKVDWCTSRKLDVDVSPDQSIDLCSRSRNPFLALYWITFDRREYIDLTPDPEPGIWRDPQPSTNR